MDFGRVNSMKCNEGNQGILLDDTYVNLPDTDPDQDEEDDELMYTSEADRIRSGNARSSTMTSRKAEQQLETTMQGYTNFDSQNSADDRQELEQEQLEHQLIEHQIELGDIVQVKDLHDSQWHSGVVTCVDPLEVRVTFLDNAKSWHQVRPDLAHLEVDVTHQEEAELTGGCCCGLRAQVKQILEHKDHSMCAQCVQSAIVCLILLSTSCVVIETVKSIEEEYHEVFKRLEIVFTALFSIEMVLRLWIADDPCGYVRSAGNVVDMLAVFPWYVEFGFRTWSDETLALSRKHHTVAHSFQSLRMVRMLRMVRLSRVARLAKAVRHSETITTMLQSVKHSTTGLMVCVACVILATIFSATFMYYLEVEDEDTQFTSIPAAFWWALPTITGVGYGDMVPNTVQGKAAAGLCCIGGTMITALCVAIMTNSFTEQFAKNMKSLDFERRRRHALIKRKTKETAEIHNTPEAPNERKAFARVSLKINEENHMESIEVLEEAMEKLMLRLEDTSGQPVPSTKMPMSVEMLRGHSKMLFDHMRSVVDANEKECEAAALQGREAPAAEPLSPYGSYSTRPTLDRQGSSGRLQYRRPSVDTKASLTFDVNDM